MTSIAGQSVKTTGAPHVPAGLARAWVNRLIARGRGHRLDRLRPDLFGPSPGDTGTPATLQGAVDAAGPAITRAVAKHHAHRGDTQ